MRNQIKDLLMERIIEGQYPPGARLIEMRIARELNVSQAPVREALRDLESVGVIETFAFRGARVRKPSAEELIEAFPVRAALESLAAAEATSRVTDEEIDQLEGLIERMEAAAQQGDAHRQSLANAEFHALIVDAAGNATLRRQWALLEPFARTYLTAAHSGIDLIELAQRHRRILEPMRRRDADAAAAAMRDHLMEAANWLKEANSK
jgi:DNA-binding GntR family transcriptional regulator